VKARPSYTEKEKKGGNDKKAFTLTIITYMRRKSPPPTCLPRGADSLPNGGKKEGPPTATTDKNFAKKKGEGPP